MKLGIKSFIVSISVLMTVSVSAAQSQSRIDEIAARQLQASNNDTLANCVFAQDVMWEAANDLINAIPGISVFAKFAVAFSKIGNNVACKKLGKNASTLAYMAEVAAEIAKKEVDSALRAQLTNEADDLFEQLGSVASRIQIFEQLTPYEQTRLLSQLNALGSDASQLEAAGRDLSFESMPALLIISSVKLGAYAAEYQLSEEGPTKDDLGRLIVDEANDTIETLERQEGKLTSYINAIKKHYRARIHGPDVGSVLEIFRVDADVKTKDGRILWEEHYRCQRFVLAFGLCKDYDRRKREIADKANNELKRQKRLMRQGIINLEYASIKTKAMAYATQSKPKDSWIHFMSAQSGRKCLDATSEHKSGREVHMHGCNLNNRNQNWYMDDKGAIHSATSFDKCLAPKNGNISAGTRLQLADCSSTAQHQRFVMHRDDTIRPVSNSRLCIDVEGASTSNGAKLSLWSCHHGDNQRWYAYSHIKSGIGTCLDTSGSLNNGKETHAWRCGINNNNQSWAFSGDGFMRSFVNPEKCLDPTGPSVAQGTEIQMWDCIEGYNFHKWVRHPDNSIRPWLNTNMCMDIEKASTENGARILLWSCHGQDNQQWFRDPVKRM